MTPERWQKIEFILQEALDLPIEEREAFVREKSGGDEDLRREIERLLAREESDESFLESPVWTDSLFLGADARGEIASSLEDKLPAKTEKSFVGKQIGAYRLVEELGKGGMGVVYLATRADGEFKQKVAVKLIKRGMDTDFILRRFRQERQVAAALNHPHIAKLFDGGTTGDGSPYFVMEYVEGAAFFKYTNTQRLNLRAKLELFLKICRAISYAHKKRIIHRDIKPGNILVTEDGEPKLLDFGIAKILDPDLIDESLMPTETQMRLMTPEYASPEQVRGDEIGEASDQYSLGVLLYELLTGNRPYKFPSRAPHEIARVICEEMPSEPSSGDFGKFIAENAELSSLDQDFCRKLDCIVLKSLRKKPSERYASVKDFIDDIECFLRNEPVFADASADEKHSVKANRKKLKSVSDSRKSIAVLPSKVLNVTSADEKELTGGEQIPTTGKIAAPRRYGIKQGAFLIIVSFLLLPILVASVAAFDSFSPIHSFVIFMLFFGGGLIRIIYALFFEPKSALAVGDAPSNQHVSFSSRPTLSLDESQNNSENSVPTSNPKRRWVRRSLYGLAVVSLLSFGYLVYHVVTLIEIDSAPKFEIGNRRWRDNFAAAMSVRRLTASGKAGQAIISPDGKNVAYIVEDGGQRSLWLRPIDSENARQLLAPEAVFYTEIKFLPDGKYVYYIASRVPARTLYRVSLNGGIPEKISGNVLNLFAFSPDGRRIVYDSRNSDNNQNSLFIAELDDNSQVKSARTLVVLEMPNYFPGGISFAPDGEKIVYPRTVIENNREVINLFVYDLAANTNERLGDKNFDRINATGWRKVADEIVVSAKESDSANYQLWVVNYPSGEFSRLTNDFTDYFGVSLTDDSATLATTKIGLISNIWTGDLTESNKNYESKIKQITTGVDRRDGFYGLSQTKDNRILYVAGAENERGIAVMNADGTNNRTIPTGAADPKFPTLTSDNRFLIYADKKGKELNIWRFDMTGEKPAQMSSRYAVTPSVSPDNRSVVYAMFPDASSNRLLIHRQPLEGGEETVLANETGVRPVVSPDGRFVACNYASDETNKIWQIAILPVDKNFAPKIIQPYKNNFFVSPQERPLAWSPDGRFLYFLNNADNITNIFRVRVEGDAAPVQVTHFTSGEIFDFALAPDGKSFVLARGATSSDIIIFQKRIE